MNHKLLLSSFFWVAIAAHCRAESIPSFNLDRSVSQSAAVVHGKLYGTGQLQVLEVLKGKFDKMIALEDGAETFQRLQAIAKENTFEVIMFLCEDGNKGWRLVDGPYGTVAFYRDRVYLYTGNKDGFRRGQEFASLTDHNPTAYIAEARKTLAAFQERDRISAMPRGPERTAKVLAYLLAQPFESAHFHLWTLARLLEPSDGKAILAALKRSDRDSERIVLLGLARLIPLGKNAFEEIGVWAQATHPPPVRRAAFAALADIDPYRMGDDYASSLRLDEPQLGDLLSQFGSIANDHRHVAKHRKVLEALLALTSKMRKGHRDGGPQALGSQSHELLGALGCYAHPRHLPALMDWALVDDHVTSNQALTMLQSITGLKHGRAERDKWDAWYKMASPHLSREYALTTDRGRAAWLESYAQSDSATRRLLLTLWHYEEKIDEGSLVTAARGKFGDGAKTVLADLWKTKRLSPAGKQEVLEHFLKIRLVEVPLPHPKFPTIRELKIVAERDFPFPEEAWVEQRYSIVIGNDRDPMLQGGTQGAFSLGQPGGRPILVGSIGGGSYPGAPVARAVAELREVDHHAGGRVVWSKHWVLGPIVLENRAAQAPNKRGQPVALQPGQLVSGELRRTARRHLLFA